MIGVTITNCLPNINKTTKKHRVLNVNIPMKVRRINAPKIKQHITVRRIILLAILVMLVAFIVSIPVIFGHGKTEVLETELVDINAEESESLYGIPVDLYSVSYDEVSSGETFSKIMNDDHGVSLSVINALIEKSKGVFDLRNIRVGNPLIAFHSQDTTEQKLCYLVYEPSVTEYVIFGTGDSVFVERGVKDVVIEEKVSSATITSSLWGSMYANNLSPTLAVRLSEIYAWTVDFFALQKGDSFSVIYEELFIDGKSVGIGTIWGAKFTHAGKDYWAMRFDQDKISGYWDEKGNNLRKSFLKAPLKFSARISSRFSKSRLHPVLRIRRPHYGVDYACPSGTPVYAVADGTVTRKSYDRGGGNTVKIRHARGLESGYLHLSRYGKGVSPGARISQGQLIGYVGSTGMSTGAHLDFRIWQNGKPIDPLKMPAIPSDPIKSAYKDKFNRMVQDVYDEINAQ